MTKVKYKFKKGLEWRIWWESGKKYVGLSDVGEVGYARFYGINEYYALQRFVQENE